MSTGEWDPLLNHSMGERGASHPLATHVSSLLGGPEGMRSRAAVSRGDAPWERHESGSYRGIAGTEHGMCLSAATRGLTSKSQRSNTAALLDLPIVAFLRCEMSSRG